MLISVKYQILYKRARVNIDNIWYIEPNMSADVLRRRLIDALQVTSALNPDEWIPRIIDKVPANTFLSQDEIVDQVVNTINFYRTVLKYDADVHFRNPDNMLLNDLRDLTPREIKFVSETFRQAQAKSEQGLSLLCADQVAIASHESDIIENHGLLGKAAVAIIRLID